MVTARQHAVFGAGAAFTFVEVLVSVSIMLVIVTALLTIMSQTADGTRAARSRVDQFQQAQRAFETLARRIEQATLNSYWNSDTVNGKVLPYQRMSELRFICGPMQCGASPLDAAKAAMRPGHGVFFQATSGQPGADRDPAVLGLGSLMNSWGYFIEAGTDGTGLPPFLAGRTDMVLVAPRLMELCEPSKRLSIYGFTSGVPDYTGFEWFRTPLADRTLQRTVAANIAVLLVQPKLTAQESERLLPYGTVEDRDALLAPELFYHSGAALPIGTPAERNMRHRLPAMVELTMVALDSATVRRLYSSAELDPLKLRDAFHNAGTLRAELQGASTASQGDSLERRLIARHANYRIFAATVPIRSAQ